MMPSKIKFVLALAVAAMTVSYLTGCSNGSSGSSGPVDVTLWARQGDNAIAGEIKAFNKAHSDIQVKLSPIDDTDYLTKLSNAIRAHSAPDLLDFDVINAPLLSTQGQLLDVTSKAKALPDYNTLEKAGITAGSLNGKTYSLPLAVNDSQMFWNKALFKEAGLDPIKAPANLAEIMTDAQKIKALGKKGVYGFSTIGGVGLSFTALPIVWADGGDYFSPIGKDQKAQFNSKPVQGMVTWFASMWQAGLMPPTDEPNQDPGNVGQQTVQSGKVGIVFTGADTFAGHTSEWGSAAGIPGHNGNLTTEAGGNQLAITAGSKHPDQAWTVEQWLLTNGGAAKIALTNGWVPANLQVAESLATDPWDKATVNALKNSHLPLSIAYSAVVKDANGPWAQAADAIIFHGANAATETANAEQQANQLVQQAYSQVN